MIDSLLTFIRYVEHRIHYRLQFADEHPRDIEMLWGTLCQYWPNNLKVVLRYLVIVVGLAPAELIPCVSLRNWWLQNWWRR